MSVTSSTFRWKFLDLNSIEGNLAKGSPSPPTKLHRLIDGYRKQTLAMIHEANSEPLKTFMEWCYSCSIKHYSSLMSRPQWLLNVYGRVPEGSYPDTPPTSPQDSIKGSILYTSQPIQILSRPSPQKPTAIFLMRCSQLTAESLPISLELTAATLTMGRWT
jgi:hypothetical protein